MNENTSKYKYLIKNIGVLTIGNLSTKILVFLLVPVYTSVLSTEDYGIYDLVYVTIQLISPVLTCDIAAGVMRFMMEKNAKQEEIIAVATKYIISSSIVVAIALFLINRLAIIPSINGIEWIVLCYYFTYTVNQSLISFGKGIERIKDIAISGFISSCVMICSNIFFLLVLNAGLKGFFLANLLSQVTSMVYYLIRFPISIEVIKLFHNKEFEKKLISYSIPLIIVDVGWWVNNASDRYIVAYMCGASITGILAVSYKIPTVLSVIQSIFIQAWHISGIKEYSDDVNSKTNSFYCTVFRYLNLIMGISCSGLILFARYIGKMFFLKQFNAAWKYTPFLLISCVINASAGFLGAILEAKKDSARMAYSGFVGALTNIVLNIILVYAIGVQGATLATAISSLVIFLIRITVVYGNVVSLKEVRIALITWVLLAVQAVLAISINIVWWQLPIVFLLIFLYKGEKIISSISRLK